MTSQPADTNPLAAKLRGRRVSDVQAGPDYIEIRFDDASTLMVTAGKGELSLSLRPARVFAFDGPRPTPRQLEYLLFIDKYISRFGRAPAEADIERHFLVSAPSVNQMMQMLERRRFITREPGVPRSAKICIDLSTFARLSGRDDA